MPRVEERNATATRANATVAPVELCIEVNANHDFMIVDESDYEFLVGHSWRLNHNGYPVNQRGKFAHRLLIDVPEGMVIDHISGNKLDNRRKNLRVCLQSQNAKNVKRRSGGHSRFKGVTWFTTKRHKKGYWKAYIAGTHIGFFDNEIDAALAYDAKAKRLFGEFARLNFPLGVVSPLDRVEYTVINRGGCGVISPLDKI